MTLRLLYINKLGKSNYPRTLLKKNLSFLIKLRGTLIRQHGITSEEMERANAAMDKMLSLSYLALSRSPPFFIQHRHFCHTRAHACTDDHTGRGDPGTHRPHLFSLLKNKFFIYFFLDRVLCNLSFRFFLHPNIKPCLVPTQ